jgi:hypothetical protein
VLPPNTSRWGLEKIIVWPYLLPGVDPTTGTIIHWAFSSPFLISSKYKSSEAKLPPIEKVRLQLNSKNLLPPVAPPYTTIYIYSTLVDEWAALGEGGTPFTIIVKN